MALDQRNLPQTIWGAALIAMGVLLFVREPYAISSSLGSNFLNFARYFIAVFLIAGGAKKLYRLYFSGDKKPPADG